jgi:hypothetical protein
VGQTDEIELAVFAIEIGSAHVRFESQTDICSARAHVSYGTSPEISRSTRCVGFASLRFVPNFFYSSLNFFGRLIETFAPTLRQGFRGQWQSCGPGRNDDRVPHFASVCVSSSPMLELAQRDPVAATAS